MRPSLSASRLFAWMQGLSIRTQIIGLALAFGLAGAAGLAAYLTSEWAAARALAQAKAERSAHQVADELDARMREHIRVLERIAQRPQVRAMDPGACDPAVHELPRLYPELFSIGVRRLDSSLVCGTLSNVQTVLDPDLAVPMRNAISKGRPYVGVAYLETRNQRWIVVVAVPLRNAAGEIVGAVLGPLDLVRYGVRVFDRVPSEVVVSVHDAAHRILMRSHNADSMVGRASPEEMRAVSEPASGRPHGADLLGVPTSARLAPMQHGNWQVIAGVVSESDDAHLWRSLAFASAWLLASLGLLVAVGLWAGYRISAPVEGLSNIAGRVAEGETGLRAEPKGSRELVRLAQAFNLMLDKMAESRHRHAALEQHLSTLVRHAGNIVLLADGQLRIVDASEAAVTAYGYTREALLGMNLSQLREPGGEGLAAWESLATGGGAAVFEEVHRRSGGEPVEVEVSAHAFSVDGKPYLQAFVRSLAHRRAAEQQLRLLTMAVDQGQLGLMVSDEHGAIQLVNPAYAKSKGYGARELLGRSAAALHSLQAPSVAREPVWNETLNTLCWQGEVRRRRKDGSEYAAWVVVTELRDASGQATGWLLETEDTGGLARRVAELEQRLREQSDALARAGQRG